MSPAEALDCAIARGGTPSVLSTRRHRRYNGRPGEIIERMAPEVRQALTDLRSEDVSAGRVSRWAPWLASDEVFDEGLLAYRNATRDFDRRVLRLTPGPRTLRRAHGFPE